MTSPPYVPLEPRYPQQGRRARSYALYSVCDRGHVTEVMSLQCVRQSSFREEIVLGLPLQGVGPALEHFVERLQVVLPRRARM